MMHVLLPSLALLALFSDVTISEGDQKTLRCIAALDVVSGWGIADPAANAASRRDLVSRLEQPAAMNHLPTQAALLTGDELQRAFDECQTLGTQTPQPGKR